VPDRRLRPGGLIRLAAQELGRRGGQARARALSAADRSRIASQAGTARAQTLSHRERKEIASKAGRPGLKRYPRASDALLPPGRGASALWPAGEHESGRGDDARGHPGPKCQRVAGPADSPRCAARSSLRSCQTDPDTTLAAVLSRGQVFAPPRGAVLPSGSHACERQYKSRKRETPHRLLHTTPQWIKSGKPYLTGSPPACNYR